MVKISLGQYNDRDESKCSTIVKVMMLESYENFIQYLRWHPEKVDDSETIDRYTALMVAVRNNKVKEVKALIDAKADVNKQNIYKTTALIYDAKDNFPEMAQILIDAKADVDLSENDGLTALHYAAWRNHSPIVKMLIDANAKINAETYVGKTPLQYASENKYSEIVTLLTETQKKQQQKETQAPKPEPTANLTNELKQLITKQNEKIAELETANKQQTEQIKKIAKLEQQIDDLKKFMSSTFNNFKLTQLD